jgi:hypothetical protein
MGFIADVGRHAPTEDNFLLIFGLTGGDGLNRRTIKE